MIATFHHRDFTARDLLRLKAEQGSTVSCVIPTLNEAATVARVIAAVRKSLLVDEIVVVDSGSTDATREIAAAAGATVHVAAEIRPEVGPATGKGENLWKSLFVTRGDLVVFVDGDLRNPSPHFITGLVGPLLARPELGYVKAFYHRPGGGGRVTELLVRPLLREFFPELATLHQPLAGEYAARRSVLESLPFPTGYGVEIAHLLDLWLRSGSATLAQTDLVRRSHRRRPLADLGKMSHAILATMRPRLPGHGPSPHADPERPPVRGSGG